MSTASIEHQGIVESIGNEGTKVKFTALSACASCHARGFCSASEMEDKEVFIPGYSNIYSVGDKVDIVMSRSQGTKAVAIGYIYPFLLVISLLLFFSSLGLGELQTGIFSVLSLLPYYFIVYLSRKHIEKKFVFSLRKNDYV